MKDLGGDRGENDEAKDEENMGEVGSDFLLLFWLAHLIHLIDPYDEEKDKNRSQSHYYHLSDEVALDHTVHREELNKVQIDK